MKSYLDKTIFKRIKKDLAVRYGAEKADKIWAYAKEVYLKLERVKPNAD
jgi:hypothetical protein